MSERRDVIRVGAQLTSVRDKRWLKRDAVVTPLVVFVHGFTSHSGYMDDLSQYVDGSDLLAATFDYDSYQGIDIAAKALIQRLLTVRSQVGAQGFALVGHSMGGLVAMYAAAHAPDFLYDALRGIVLLGVPRAGFHSVDIVRYLLDWADAVTGVNPFARLKVCRSTEQLTKLDADALLDVLDTGDAQERLRSIPILSISGGLPYLEFGSNPALNKVKNVALQALLNEKANDGLVVESSADCSLGLPGSPMRQHNNGYADCPRTNHTYLNQNQEIADIVNDWLRTQLLGKALDSVHT